MLLAVYPWSFGVIVNSCLINQCWVLTYNGWDLTELVTVCVVLSSPCMSL